MKEITELEAEVGFVLASRFSGAILFQEIIDWCFYKIESFSDLPTYIFDIVSTSSISELRDAVGILQYGRFNYELSDAEWEALTGIAYKRGFYTKEDPCDVCTEKTALENLEKNPHILKKFKQTFPFIKLE